jgi:hypothetical protein
LANNSTGLGGAVHGIFVGTNQVYLATEKGLSYGYGSSWTNVVTSRPLNNIVRGVDSTTLYAANGYTGLRIITLDSIGGPASWNTVLAGYDVAKVYVTVP